MKIRILVVMPVTPEHKNWLEACAPDAVDSYALCEALASGHLSGAIIDVTEPESLPANHPLWQAPNLILTPHVSGGYHLQETHDRIIKIAAGNIKAFLAGEPLRNVVDFATGYRSVTALQADTACEKQPEEMLAFIKSRRSTRKYKDIPVPKEALARILEAGRFAPSGGNSQTTHLMVVQNREVLNRLAVLVEQEFAKMEVTPGLYRSMVHSIEASKRGGYCFHYHAPALIITANQKDYGNNLADCSCVLENMMLMANAENLGSCWINQLKWLNENPVLLSHLQSLGLGKNERVYGALAVGFADTQDGLPVRTPLAHNGNPITYI